MGRLPGEILDMDLFWVLSSELSMSWRYSTWTFPRSPTGSPAASQQLLSVKDVCRKSMGSQDCSRVAIESTVPECVVGEILVGERIEIRSDNHI